MGNRENEIVKLENGTRLYLDLIRIIAASFVLLGHSFYAYGIGALKDDAFFPPIQSIAVVFFFWLSGFLIAYQFSNINENFSLKNYIIHKAYRIIPEYWLCLFVILGIDALHIFINPSGYAYYESFNIKTFLGNMFFLQGLPIDGIRTTIEIFGSARPLWTLSVQWWFYFLFAIIYIMVKKKKITIIEFGFCGLIVILNVAYLKEFGIIFAFGIIGYHLYKKINATMGGLFAVFSAMLYIVYGRITNQIFSNYGIILLSVTLIGGAAFFSARQVSNPNIFRTIGLVTFEIYLIHYSVIDVIHDIFADRNSEILFLIGIIISLVVSILIFYCVKKSKDLIQRKLG